MTGKVPCLMVNRLALLLKGAPSVSRDARSSQLRALVTITRALFLAKEMWVHNLLAFLAARAAVLGTLHPFGAAFFLAILVAGERRRAVAAAVSVLAGSLTALAGDHNIPLAVWMITALALSRGAAPARKGLAAAKPILLWAVLYGAARAVPGLINGGSTHELISVAVEATLTAAAAFLFLPVTSFPWAAGVSAVQRLERTAVVSLGFLAAVAGLGLLSVEWVWMQPAEVWFRWLTLFAGLVGGGGGGAAMGTFLDVLVSLMARLPLGGLGLYGVGGLFGGLLARRGKLGVACGFFLGQMLVSVHTEGVEEVLLGIAHTVIAFCLLSLTPRRWAARLSWAMPGSDVRASIELAKERRLREAINSRLRDVSAVFHELADVFADPHRRNAPSSDQEGLQGLVERVWQLKCRACPGFDACWREAFYRSYWDLVDLVAIAAQKGGGITALDLPPGLSSRCSYPSEFVASFNAAFSGKVPSRGKSDSLDLVPQQLRGVAELIQNTAEQVKIDTGRAEELEAYLREECALARLDVAEVRVAHAASHPEVEIEYTGACDGCGRCVELLVPVVERVLGHRYSGRSICRREEQGVCRVSLTPEPLYELKVEVARLAKDGSSVSGDSYCQVELGGGRVALMLSDGMGVGDRAAIESQATVGLFEKMLRAGFDYTFAAHTVNAALLLRSPEEMFATVDLAIVDLFSGDVEFLKVGSSPTFIKRDHEVEVVRSNSLPVGILNEIDVAANVRVMEPGDVLVMMTDGILDSLPDRADKEEWIARMLRREETQDPAQLVQLLVERAKQAAGGKIRDDVTLMVARLVRRKDSQGEIPVYARRRPSTGRES